MTRRPGQSAARLAVCGLLAAGAAPACAQGRQPADGEPIVLGEDEAYTPWQLDHLGAAVEAEARYRSFRRKTQSQGRLTDTEQFLLGRFELSGRAFVGHKNLLDLTGRVGIGWEESRLESDVVGASQTDSDLSLVYDVAALILAESDAPTTLYSRRDERQLEREFAGSIDSTSAEHGVITRIASDTAPTFIHIYRRENDQSNTLGDIDYSLKQDSLVVRTAPDLGDSQELSIEYNLDLVDERQGGFFENDYTRHDAQVIHEIRFGPDQRHNLRSTGRFYDESGRADFRRYRIDELLRLKHSGAFDTRYDFAAEDATRAGQSQRYFRLRAQARYKLFDSLIAVAGLGADRLEAAGGFTSQQYFADADVQYTKLVPLGRFFASVGGSLNRQENSEQGQPLFFTDQDITLADPLPTVINRRNIVGSSVRLTNADGTRLYAEGLDYTLQVFPTHIEIRRIVGGDIAEGESLLLDYTLGPEPASTIDSTSANGSARYSFEEGFAQGLGFFIDYSWLDQAADTADPSRFILEEVTDLRYGIDYHRYAFTFSLEQRRHDSSIFPYDTTRIEGRYDVRTGPASNLSASLAHDISSYDNSGEELRLTRATIRAAGRLGQDLDLSGRLVYRDERSKLADDLAGFEQALDLTWRKGRTTVTGSLFNGFLDAGTTDSVSQTVSLGLRRTF